MCSLAFGPSRGRSLWVDRLPPRLERSILLSAAHTCGEDRLFLSDIGASECMARRGYGVRTQAKLDNHEASTLGWAYLSPAHDRLGGTWLHGGNARGRATLSTTPPFRRLLGAISKVGYVEAPEGTQWRRLRGMAPAFGEGASLPLALVGCSSLGGDANRLLQVSG
jgi:hypothetical protein